MDLTLNQIDALQELVNIGVGRAAGILNEMICSPIRLNIPSLQVLTLSELQPELEAEFDDQLLACIRMSFGGGFSGTSELIFSQESASTLVTVLIGEAPSTSELDSVKIGTLLEVGNIVLNGVMGSLSNALTQRLEYSLPTYVEGQLNQLLFRQQLEVDACVLLAKTRFQIEKLQIFGDIILFFKASSFESLLNAIYETFESEEVPSKVEE